MTNPSGAPCRLCLEAADYSVSMAASGEAGLAQAKKQPPDLALVDLRLGGMDGLAVTRALSQEAPGAQVVIMTAYATIDNAVEGNARWRGRLLSKALHARCREARRRARARVRAHATGAGRGRAAQSAHAGEEQQPRGARGIHARRARREQRRHGALARRNRHGEKPAGAPCAPAFATRRAPVRDRKLRHHQHESNRERTVRARQGRLHRSRPTARRVR